MGASEQLELALRTKSTGRNHELSELEKEYFFLLKEAKKHGFVGKMKGKYAHRITMLLIYMESLSDSIGNAFIQEGEKID